MALLKDGKIGEDRWTHLDDNSVAPDGKPVTVSLARWRKDGESLKFSGVPLGIRLTGADDVEDIANALGYLQLVAIDFPAFTDGRGYSMARILRERCGYTGEIRATGNVLCDQASLMTRCGFDAFDLAPHVSVEDWFEVLALMDVQYQPAADRRQTAAQLRHAS